MKYINLIICLLMLLFIAVQYNDPDGALWMLIYAVPALWAGLSFLRPAWLVRSVGQWLWLLSLVIAFAGMIYLWPASPHWWTKEVWWETETAREGMGMMIVVMALAMARLCARRS